MKSRIVVAACLLGSCGAFQIPRTARTTTTRATLSLQAVVPGMEANVVDALSALDHASAVWLADATAEVATQADGGWWQNFINIFKYALETVHSTIDPPLRSVGITQTWGISIAVFTALVRSTLVPLSIQQSKSAEYMKALKPYVTEISNKFKDNPDRKNMAIGKLYEDANQNPLSGCLFSLAQLPILLGLYRGIRNLAIDGEIDERFLWIPSLQGPVHGPDFRDCDWLLTGWHSVAGSPVPEPSLGWETTLAFLVMPVLLVLGQSVTMKALSPEPDTATMSAEELDQFEKSQRIIKFLPLMIGFFSLQVPAGLTVYWFTTNLFTLSQSLAVRAYYAANPPKIELPDYWDALDDLDTMTPEEKRAAAKAGLATGPSWEDMLTQAQFHVVVDRSTRSMRSSSPAWARVQEAADGIPAELQEWVGVVPTNGATEEQQQSEASVAASAASA